MYISTCKNIYSVSISITNTYMYTVCVYILCIYSVYMNKLIKQNISQVFKFAGLSG